MSRRTLTSPRAARSSRTPALAASVLLATLALSACSGDDGDGDGDSEGPLPTEVLAEAKQVLDETSGVAITLEADKLSSSVTGIRKATGVGVHPPAFEGTFDLSVNGLPATAEVVAVDGKTYARNSLLLPDWTVIDPADYGAPDPNQLMGEDAGFSTLLVETTDVQVDDQVRGGEGNKEILTEYSGTVPGTVVANIVPSAVGDFAASYTISEDGELRSAQLTGVFYEDDDTMTYTMTFDDYGTEQDITAP